MISLTPRPPLPKIKYKIIFGRGGENKKESVPPLLNDAVRSGDAMISLTPRPPLPKIKYKIIFGRGGEDRCLVPPLLMTPLVFVIRRGG